MEEKKYINIDNMATRLCQILKDARESMVDDKNKDFIMENFSDEYLEDYSNVMAWQFNSDMKKYLHNPDHRICGNFNNIDYDYPYHIYGEVTYDTPLVNAMIARLDAGEDSEEPRWVNNGTDSVHQKDGYTLIYNSTIGGVYMLYREANDAEIEWYNNN